MTFPSLSQNRFFYTEWAVLSCTLLLFCLVLIRFNALEAIDQSIYAHLLSAEQKFIWSAPHVGSQTLRLHIYLGNLIPLAMALLGVILLSPRHAMICTVSLFFIVIGFAHLGFALNIWWAPASSLLCLLILPLLWRWTRAEGSMRRFDELFTSIDKELKQQVDYGSDAILAWDIDPLAQRIQRVQFSLQRVRDLRRMIRDGLNNLSQPSLVTTIDGNVILSNPSAQMYFESLGIKQIQNAHLPYLFAQLEVQTPPSQQHQAHFSWWNILDLEHHPSFTQGIEVKDPLGRELKIKSTPNFSANAHLTGWFINLWDLTPLRASERNRDETLHFLSHDLRAPQASILALVELQRFRQTALAPEIFLQKIEKACRSTLEIADNFVQLAEAESKAFVFEEMDFQDILFDAADEMWLFAKNKQIQIETLISGATFPVNVDRNLITRAIINLLSNAIKYSHKNTSITCSLELESNTSEVVCRIQDHGYGIPRADQTRLFQRTPYVKSNEKISSGLGMVFVKAVIEKHQGQISFVSASNEGTTFTIRLPHSTN